MKNLVINVKSALKKEYYIREMILLVVISLSLLCFGIYESLALFQTNIEKSSVATIVAGDINFILTSTNSKYNSSTGQITVASGTTEEVPLTITNNTPISAKYKLYYKAVTPETLPDGVTISVASTEETGYDEGVLETDESVTRNISIENNSTSSVTLQFGVEKGYAHNELSISSGNSQLGYKEPTPLNNPEFIDSDNSINISSLYPLVREVALPTQDTDGTVITAGEAVTKTFKIKNTNDRKIFVHISLDNMTLPETLKRYDFMWSLYEVTDTTNNIEKNVSNGTFLVDGNSIEIAPYQVFEVNDEKTYNLYIWLEEIGLFEDITIEEEFKATITAIGEDYWTSPENDFVVDENGVLTAYNGPGGDIIIPPTVNGITVKEIGEYAFNGYDPDTNDYKSNVLTNVVIPDTVTKINGVAFSTNKLTKLFIPNSVTTFDDNHGCEFCSNQLTFVSIPNSVTSIGYETFYDNNLKSIFIPNSITDLDGTFDENELENVIIPNSITYIGEYTFGNNQLATVVIPESVTLIDGPVFGNNPNLTQITVLGKSEAPEFNAVQFTGFIDEWNVISIGEDGNYIYADVIYRPNY